MFVYGVESCCCFVSIVCGG